MATSGTHAQTEIEERLELRVAELGFELVECRRRGHARRPVLELRIDKPSGEGVSVSDCALVSRAVEKGLDADPRYPERYVLEVSSPGVERRLLRDGDFDRFAGRRVSVKGSTERFGASGLLVGELLGISTGGERLLRLRLDDGSEEAVLRAEAREVRLVYDWNSGGMR